MRLEETLCVRAGSQGERAADKLNHPGILGGVWFC